MAPSSLLACADNEGEVFPLDQMLPAIPHRVWSTAPTDALRIPSPRNWIPELGPSGSVRAAGRQLLAATWLFISAPFLQTSRPVRDWARCT